MQCGAKKRLGLKMLPYLRANDNTFLSYNNVSITKAENKQLGPVKDDTFKASVVHDGNFLEDYFQRGSGVFCLLGPDSWRAEAVLCGLPVHRRFRKVEGVGGSFGHQLFVIAEEDSVSCR